MLFLIVLIACVVYVSMRAPVTSVPPVVTHRSDCENRKVDFHLCSTQSGNESIVLDCVLSDSRSLFLLDTGYAGPPVISKSFLAVQHRSTQGSVSSRFAEAIRMSSRVSDDEMDAALRSLLMSRKCRAFTSGCRMRLMGIGSTSEVDADMLLCPGLVLCSEGEFNAPCFDADVLVTHPLRRSVHILTSDYLLHRNPCVICPAEGSLWLSLSGERRRSMEASFAFHSAESVGGSLAIYMLIGGARMKIVLDTGSPSPLSIGMGAGKRIKKCSSPLGGVYTSVQHGVNDEKICSTAVDVDVKIGSIHLGSIDAFLNDEDVEGADGYAGMGLLRALDMWFEPGRVGLRRNALPTQNPSSGRKGKCERARLPSCAAVSL